MKILLTCGLGDFFAIESLVSKQELDSITHIYYATRMAKTIQDIIGGYPKIFPNLIEQTIIFNAFTGPYTELFSISDKERLKSLPLLLPNIDLDDIEDWHIIKIGKEYLNGNREYKGSSLTNSNIEKISHIYLPKEFVFIHPYSENVRAETRDINEVEWKSVIKYLEHNNIHGIIVNQGSENHPSHPLIKDFTNKLTILQAIEILKQAKCFIGASSCFSVLASKILPAHKLFIKGHNELKFKWSKVYYSPQTDNEFIYNDLTKI